MTDEREQDEPNEFGFAGAATAPQPERRTENAEDGYGESVAVPAGDLTGAITGAIEEATERDDDKD